MDLIGAVLSDVPLGLQQHPHADCAGDGLLQWRGRDERDLRDDARLAVEVRVLLHSFTSATCHRRAAGRLMMIPAFGLRHSTT